jgi:hypothetical protein
MYYYIKGGITVQKGNVCRKLQVFIFPLDQSILLLNSLYSNASTCVKWNGNISELFTIEQGVRQGGAISADLYKVYVNPLLDILSRTGLG